MTPKKKTGSVTGGIARKGGGSTAGQAGSSPAGRMNRGKGLWARLREIDARKERLPVTSTAWWEWHIAGLKLVRDPQFDYGAKIALMCMSRKHRRRNAGLNLGRDLFKGSLNERQLNIAAGFIKMGAVDELVHCAGSAANNSLLERIKNISPVAFPNLREQTKRKRMLTKPPKVPEGATIH